MADVIDFPTKSEEGRELSEEAILACMLAGKHLMNSLSAIGVHPGDIETQSDALERVWPTKWAYDAWCAWHACRITIRKAGWDPNMISLDRRTEWRTSASYVAGKAIIGPE